MREKKFGDPPTPPKKSILAVLKAKGHKGLSWGLEILHGLLTHRNIRIPMKKNFGDPPYPPKKGHFGRTKGPKARFEGRRHVLKAEGPF